MPPGGMGLEVEGVLYIGYLKDVSLEDSGFPYCIIRVKIIAAGL